ncbi:MAG TPA: ATP-dependent RNA helicase HrpA [Streptosporangiaceae bacterium]|nr:ATP-dependent RNA helicase HrpA [Streptosporangiaceae bacterium]
MTSTPAELRAALPGLMLRDQRRLGRRVHQAAGLRDAAARDKALSQVTAELDTATERIAARRRAVPVLSYPPELPVSQLKDEIAEVIRDHQVVIIAGETGSGKTTQLPKICLELGRGVAGQIGHTQPRRIAARTVAERIAEELGTELGTTVGYKVRFTDHSSDSTLVKLMTDGILLTEMQRDRQLLRYDTLIIDEAHERSLNIDFILGYLRRLLPSRPDLKVIITSATIDPDRFSRHFAVGESDRHSAGGESSKHSAVGESGQHSAAGEPPQHRTGSDSPQHNTPGESGQQGSLDGAGAPVIEVSGRTYPVEVRYRPVADPDNPDAEPRDQIQAIDDAVTELCAAGPGDILVFLSGEREIRDTADALAGRGQFDVLPLYARLSAAEQHKVFEPHSRRRVVLATNVAETSLTVPGIHYVIDPGTARISRYGHRTKVQRLPIEPISQASANQRAGRCGRTADGICIRLYSADDFAARPEFTDPEILRTSLAAVILRMAALDLGDVAEFPFVDSPDSRQVADGIRLLEELGALVAGTSAHRRLQLTDTGRKLAELPLDPRLGRMILEAGQQGCVREVLIITAALSIQDPRERPADARDAADARHRRFAEPGSDFLALVTLWDYLREQQRELSSSAFRRMCRREYLHYLRTREWQDVHGQLRQAAASLGITAGAGEPEPVAPDREPGTARFAESLAQRVHTAVLAGLLSHIGMKDAEATSRGRRRGPAEFSGARGARFAIFPDSALARNAPQWVMAAELVETSRLWARTAARIEPEWAEALAGHLLRRTYSEPRWDARRGAAVALERVTLYGLPIVAARTVSYGRIDPAAARELFIRSALVEGDWHTRHRFFHDNRRLLDEAADLERRARRRGIVVDDDALFEFYDDRIPASVTSARHFDSWWKKARQSDPGLLTFTPGDLIGPAAGQIQPADYPVRWGEFPLSYEFAPGERADGVTVDVPLASLNQVSGAEFGWLVPGLREELVTELIRALPKGLRTAFVPAPDTARTVLARLGEPRGDVLEAVGRELERLGGVTVPRTAFDLSKLPPYLRINFRVTDHGKVLASGKNLTELRAELAPKLRRTLADAAQGLTRTGLRTWDVGTLPRVFEHGQVRAYPALADAGDSVDVRLFETEAQAEAAMRRGTRRLIVLQVTTGARGVAARLPVSAKLAMSRAPYPGAIALLDDCAACAADEIIAAAGGPAWDQAGFGRLLEAARLQLATGTARVISVVARVMAQAQETETALSQARSTSPAMSAAIADMRAQLAGLIYEGFVSETGTAHLSDLVRYLRGISRRLEKAPGDLVRDAERMAVVHEVTQAWQDTRKELAAAGRSEEEARPVRWLIEELRVSLFAQALGTPVRVSERRILTALDDLAG